MSGIISVENMCLWYGSHQALHNITIDIPEKSITALIGPSGCGKSTFLKTLDRMNDLIPDVKITGSVKYKDEDIFDPSVDVSQLRRQIGMVFQKPNPFPMSIYDNIAYGPRTHGVRNKAKLDDIVERSLRGGGHLGRGEGPAEEKRPGPVRRPAAAAVHRPGPGSGARCPADGRTHQRPGPHFHR